MLRLTALALATLALVGCASKTGVAPVAPVAPSPAASTAGGSCVALSRGSFGAEVSDARIAEAWPDTNYGKESVGFAGFVGKGARETLLKFDTRSIPTNVRIKSATITLHRETCGCSNVTVHRATRAWDEDEVTWSKFGNAFDADPVAVIPDGDEREQGYGQVSFDATNLVRGWVDGSIANDGLVLAQRGGNTTFATSESDRQDERPRLEVCFEAVQ